MAMGRCEGAVGPHLCYSELEIKTEKVALGCTCGYTGRLRLAGEHPFLTHGLQRRLVLSSLLGLCQPLLALFPFFSLHQTQK